MGGAQGILLVYDITNKWSFEGMDRWVREVEEHAPGIPKVLVGNRLHLAFKRQVDQTEAESYAERNHMGFYEVSPLVNFNITESFQELSRMALKRNGMERLWDLTKCCLCTSSVVTVLWLELTSTTLINFRSQMRSKQTWNLTPWPTALGLGRLSTIKLWKTGRRKVEHLVWTLLDLKRWTYLGNLASFLETLPENIFSLKKSYWC